MKWFLHGSPQVLHQNQYTIGMLSELITDIWVSGEDMQTAQETLHQHAIDKNATKPQKQCIQMR